jgi:hypothetical protein
MTSVDRYSGTRGGVWSDLTRQCDVDASSVGSRFQWTWPCYQNQQAMGPVLKGRLTLNFQHHPSCRVGDGVCGRGGSNTNKNTTLLSPAIMLFAGDLQPSRVYRLCQASHASNVSYGTFEACDKFYISQQVIQAERVHVCFFQIYVAIRYPIQIIVFCSYLCLGRIK